MHLLVKYMKDLIIRTKDNPHQQGPQQQFINQSLQAAHQQSQILTQNPGIIPQASLQQTQIQNCRNTSSTPPSLIPSGEFTTRTSWNDLEEYYSLFRHPQSEVLASKQKLLGNADFQEKRYEAALSHYSKAIKLNPEYVFF